MNLGVRVASLGDFSRIVSAIHAAAITSHHWVEAMEAVRSTFASTAAGMMMFEGTTRVIHDASIPPDAESAYRNYYRRVDYVLHAVERGPVGLIRGGAPLIALNARSEFNVDWMRPHQMDGGVFVRLTGGPVPACLAVATPKGSEAFASTEHLQMVSALVPHLQQALRAQDHLKELVHRADDVAEAVQHIRHGVYVVGSAARVIYANHVAESIEASGDGPYVRSGCLGLKNPSAEAALRKAVTIALGDDGAVARSGSSMSCPRIGGERSYILHVLPFTSTPMDGRDPQALVIVIDPHRQTEPAPDVLQRLYGLTRAEAEVALRLTRGDGLKPISDELSVSIATVRTHLAHVFGKTGTHRQAELVRLLLAITP